MTIILDVLYWNTVVESLEYIEAIYKVALYEEYDNVEDSPGAPRVVQDFVEMLNDITPKQLESLGGHLWMMDNEYKQRIIFSMQDTKLEEQIKKDGLDRFSSNDEKKLSAYVSDGNLIISKN